MAVWPWVLWEPLHVCLLWTPLCLHKCRRQACPCHWHRLWLPCPELHCCCWQARHIPLLITAHGVWLVCWTLLQKRISALLLLLLALLVLLRLHVLLVVAQLSPEVSQGSSQVSLMRRKLCCTTGPVLTCCHPLHAFKQSMGSLQAR